MGRPVCTECSDRLRAKRGCFKPGFAVEGSGSVFRFTSPVLYEFDDGSEVLRECPTGRVLREAPWAYDVINAHGSDGLDGLALLRFPRRMQRMFSIVAGEKMRLRDIEESRRKTASDASYGARLIKGAR